jgi:hypothetical protein
MANIAWSLLTTVRIRKTDGQLGCFVLWTWCETTLAVLRYNTERTRVVSLYGRITQPQHPLGILRLTSLREACIVRRTVSRERPRTRPDPVRNQFKATDAKPL